MSYLRTRTFALRSAPLAALAFVAALGGCGQGATNTTAAGASSPQNGTGASVQPAIERLNAAGADPQQTVDSLAARDESGTSFAKQSSADQRARNLSPAAVGSILNFIATLSDLRQQPEVPEASRATEPPPAPTPQMQAVLDELAALGAKPVETLNEQQARTQPGPADAVRSLLTKSGQSTAPEAVGSVQDRTIPGPAGQISIRVYTPSGTGPFPIVQYIHGGGWVIANLDTYDASARALTNAARAIVVSTEYRHAPESKFPAAHDDVYATYQWILANSAELNGIAGKVAIAGESAGGNMAASTVLRARDNGLPMPLAQILIYPVTNAALDSPSQQQNRDAKPLSTAGLQWFYARYLNGADDGANPRFSVLREPNLAGVSPALVITADIDPLRSEGRAYADALRAAGVYAEHMNFEGVTHEFFGMGAVLDQARLAVTVTGVLLKLAFVVPQ